jgi:release factor glutamine methyltransferase
LVGKREFYSLSFRVTPDVLIPRPETELVVVETLDAIGAGPKSNVHSPKPALVADVGTGSGAIAVAVARHAPHGRMIAVDMSPAALAIAKENAAHCSVAERIKFVQGDLLAGLPAKPAFNVIASNPPYVSESEYAALAPAVKDHEPRQALVAGPLGTEVIERLIPQAAERLLAGGWLITEVSPMIAGRVLELVQADGRFEPASLVKDLAGLARLVKARRKSE